MVLVNIKRHFTSKYANLQSKNKNYFERVLNNEINHGNKILKTITICDKP